MGADDVEHIIKFYNVLQFTSLNATSLDAKTGQTKTVDRACQYKNSLDGAVNLIIND